MVYTQIALRACRSGRDSTALTNTPKMGRDATIPTDSARTESTKASMLGMSLSGRDSVVIRISRLEN